MSHSLVKGKGGGTLSVADSSWVPAPQMSDCFHMDFISVPHLITTTGFPTVVSKQAANGGGNAPNSTRDEKKMFDSKNSESLSLTQIPILVSLQVTSSPFFHPNFQSLGFKWVNLSGYHGGLALPYPKT